MPQTNGRGPDELLRVENLQVTFRTDEGPVRAVEDVSFAVHPGRTLGIVGESGSGKSVSASAVMRLLPGSAALGAQSSIHFVRKGGETVDIAHLNPRSAQMRDIRGAEIAMIFQEPMASFSPVYTVGSHIMEAILEHSSLSKREAKAIAVDMLARVGIAYPERRVDQYPFELSGGMRQRAMIAVALAAQPSLLIADEPTTSLDVTIQAQILTLLRDLQRELGMAIIFISHDLGVMAQIAHEIVVMYLGEIMEQGTAREVIKQPKHPYTRSLLQSIPRLDALGKRLQAIGGVIPSPLERPTGCPFHTRCPEALPGVCDASFPKTKHFSKTHIANCHLYD